MKKEIKKTLQFNEFLHDLFMVEHKQEIAETKISSGKVKKEKVPKTLKAKVIKEKVVRKKMLNNIYGTPLKKTLHWMLPEDQHMYFKQHEFSKLYEKMKEGIVADVESYDQKWSNFQKKNGSHLNKKSKKGIVIALREDYYDLKNSFALAPTYVKETLVVLFSVYFFLLLAASFPTLTNKYISYFFVNDAPAKVAVVDVVRDRTIGEGVKTDVIRGRNVGDESEVDRSKDVSNLALYFSEYIKKNSDTLQNQKNTQISVKQSDLLGRVAGVEAVSE